MKFVLLLLFLAGTVVVGYPFFESEKIWPIPQRDGTVRYLTEKQAQEEANLETRSSSSKRLDKISFFLFTKSNPTNYQELETSNTNLLKSSNFNSNYPTVFMVHGWGGGYGSIQNTKIREALLLNGEGRNYNFIVVDWSVYAESDNYLYSKNKCQTAGEVVASFIDFLHNSGGLTFKTLRLIGHSLGAHVVGFAGKNVKNGKINKIVGLDPAMPLFNYENPSTRLASDDATYVETIQTNGMTKGFFNPIGKAAFYPNGGQLQPGCGMDIAGTCSHERSVEFYAEAIALDSKNRFVPTKCDSFESLKVDANSCNTRVSGIRMGSEENNGKANGIYYLKTNPSSPYGMG